MSPLALVLLALAGGLGAVVRFVLDGWAKARFGGERPWGTIGINLTGSFLLGLLTGLGLYHGVPEAWRAVLGTGFLGGYTTFSTASFETVRLAQERRWTMALVNGLGMLVAAVVLAGLGLWLGAR